MSLQNITFLTIFLPIVLLIYWLPWSQRGRSLVLFLASLVFYASWSPWFIWAILLNILMNTLFVFFIQKSSRKKIYMLVGGILFNTAFYFYFRSDLGPGKIIGFSFSYLMIVSLLVEVYYQQIQTEGFFDVGLFITYFPQLSAGPISDPKILLPQLKKEKNIFDVDWISGISEFVYGHFLKTCCGDLLSLIIVDPVFQNMADYDRPTLALTGVAATFQVYFDFAGYTHMARGVSRLLGIELAHNFRGPLFSQDFVDLWSRWHLSLSLWLRNYLYFPLLRLFQKKKGHVFIVIPILLTWLFAGLWHGFEAHYLLYGMIHGILVSFFTLLYLHHQPERSFSVLKALSTLLLFSLTTVIFKLPDMNSVFQYFSQLTVGVCGTQEMSYSVFFLLTAFGLFENGVIYFKKESVFGNRGPIVKGILVGLCILYIYLAGPKNYVPFEYFKF